MNLFTSESQSLKGNPKIRPNSICIAVIDDRETIKHDLVRYLVETYTENTLYNLQKRRCDILGFFKETDIDDIPETYDGESSAHRHKHPKITKADLIDLMESMDTIKHQIMEADFEQMEEFYMTNYTLASLYQIADYYKLRRRVLKPAMVQDIVVYETNLDHFEVVYKRRKLWAYMEELKADEYLGRFINIQLGCE